MGTLGQYMLSSLSVLAVLYISIVIGVNIIAFTIAKVKEIDFKDQPLPLSSKFKWISGFHIVAQTFNSSLVGWVTVWAVVVIYAKYIVWMMGEGMTNMVAHTIHSAVAYGVIGYLVYWALIVVSRLVYRKYSRGGE